MLNLYNFPLYFALRYLKITFVYIVENWKIKLVIVNKHCFGFRKQMKHWNESLYQIKKKKKKIRFITFHQSQAKNGFLLDIFLSQPFSRCLIISFITDFLMFNQILVKNDRRNNGWYKWKENSKLLNKMKNKAQKLFLGKKMWL